MMCLDKNIAQNVSCAQKTLCSKILEVVRAIRCIMSCAASLVTWESLIELRSKDFRSTLGIPPIIGGCGWRGLLQVLLLKGVS